MSSPAGRLPLDQAWLLAGLLLALCLWGTLGAARLGFDNSIDQFAVKDREAAAAWSRYLENFEPTAYVIVTVAQPRTAGLEELIREADPVVERLAAAAEWRAVYSLKRSIPSEARQGFWPGGEHAAQRIFPFVDQDGTRYSAIFELPELDREQTRRFLGDWLQKLDEERSKLKRGRILAAGEPLLNHHLNEGSLEVKHRLFPALLVACLLLIGGLFRDWRVLVIATLGLGAALAGILGIMQLNGQPINLVTNLIPALTLVLGMAMLMHVLLAISHEGALTAGVRAKLRANALVAFTTSLGFGALATSRVAPIATMGLYMAGAIWLLFVSIHLAVLGAGSILRLEQPRRPMKGLTTWLQSPTYERIAQTSTLRWAPFALLPAGLWLGASNPLESNSLFYFPSGHEIREDTMRMEAHVTGAGALELLAPLPEGTDEIDEEFLAKALSLEDELLQLPRVRHLLSIGRLTRLPFLEEASEEVNLSPEFAERLISERYYRVQLFVETMDREAYSHLEEAIRARHRAAGLPGQVTITGVLDRALEIQDYLLRSLSSSLGLTLVLVLVLIGITLQTRLNLPLVLVPNLTPLACMAAAMYVFDFHTSISTVMVFSIALGIAVDDTIHLLDSYQNATGGALDRWRATIERDAAAISATSLVLTCGFLLLATSSFLPTIHFGVLLSIGMVTAFLGDILFLPSCLGVSEDETSSAEKS